jgi:hypothetical protein
MVEVWVRATAEEVRMHVKALSGKQPATLPRKHAKRVAPTKNQLTIRDLGWTRERAREVRAKLATFAADWDDPSMDVYNEL